MGATKLNSGAKLYAFALVAAGAAAGVRLILSSLGTSWDLRPVLFLGLLTVAGPALSVTRQGYLPSRIVHQIGSSFAYALFFLCPPGLVCIVLWIMTAADGMAHRRRPLTAAFNAGQLGIALLAAVNVRGLLEPSLSRLEATPRSILSAVLSLAAFSLVNQMLTHGVLSLVSRRPFYRLGLLRWSGFLIEALSIVSGIGMAVLWQIEPWFVLLGAIPIWAFMLLFSQLARREAELTSRQEDLRSLQGLGLELGAELDGDRLREAVVRITTKALQAAGAFFAVRDGKHANLLVLAQLGIEPPPPATLRIARLDEEFFRAGSIRSIADFPSERTLYPELAFLPASGVLCAPVEILGKPEGVLVLFHGEERRSFDGDDVSRLETLVRFVNVALSNSELVRELREMQEQLAQTEKMSAMGMLVSGVAHELNNPLTTVVGYSQLLLGQEDDAARRRMIERVLGEAERASKIVQNLLTFSRKQKPEKRLTDINEVLEQVLELRDYHLRIQDVEVVRRFARNLPPVLVDAHQFQQVFLNLLTNAEDALKEKRRRGRIVVETRDLGGWVQVRFSDDGPGIPAANLKRIFLPFFTTKELGRGTGLGLSICYGIVQEHGGRIEADSRENQGATFLLEIPTAKLQTEPGVPERTPEVRPPPKPAGGRLLVVDDEATIADMVREALEGEGWSVVTAGDGGEALEILAESEFDVLLVDLRMPGMDGRAFYEALEEQRPELLRRVLFATGDTGGEDTTRFLEETGKMVLAKPYDLRDLVEAVSRVAGGSAQVH